MNRKPEAPRRRGFRPLRLLLGLAVLLALLGAGHAVLWTVVAGRLEEGFQRWAALRRAQGWQVQHEPARRGGWPLSATLTLPQLRLTAPPGSAPVPLAWQVETIRLRIVPPHLRVLLVEAEGPQHLLLNGRDFPFEAERLTARVPLPPDAPPEAAEIEADQLHLALPAGVVMVAGASAQLQGQGGASAGDAALSLALDLRGITLPWALPLGRQVETASLKAALTGPLPDRAPPARGAAAWRDSGGTLEVRELTLHWGEVAASAAATLALDAALQPVGAGTLRVAGATQAVDALAEARLLAPRAASLARGVLPLLVRPDPAGGPPQLEVPVTLQDRTLMAARIPVVRLPALDWGR